MDVINDDQIINLSKCMFGYLLPISSSSAPQAQNVFAWPFTSLYCSVVSAKTPPAYVFLQSLKPTRIDKTKKTKTKFTFALD